MSKVGKILVAVVTIAAIIALNAFAPGIGTALTVALGFKVSAFLVVAIGSVLISLASGLLTSALFKPKSPMQEAKVNVRLETPPRWICGGQVLQGGGVLFAEFDSVGNLWWLIVHADSILTGPLTYYFDSVPVTLDGSGNVTTTDFTYKNVSYFRIWTHTFTEDDPTPDGAAELAAAFPGKWDVDDHRLVGTTFTVIRGNAIKLEDRAKIYRWRGAIGLGEPNIAVLGDWSNMYDPRDETQVLGDRSTYKPSRNAEIMWAWWRTHPFGMRKSESEINWEQVAIQADICDQTVTGIEGDQPRYECAIAARDDVERGNVQEQIMQACDGQIVFDDDGKSWMRVGAYYTPTLTLSRNRDIITMESVEARDGQSETQGVVVRYIEPNAGYTLQPSAPWVNPEFYDPGQGNTFLTVDIPTISNHNQAMRVAKALGKRSQPLQKIAPTVGLRGLQAMQERVVNIVYDNTFAGDYEIATPVEVDESGMFCSLGLVPVDADRWTLLSGEEKPRPNANNTEESVVVSDGAGVSSTYNNGRIEAVFDAPNREDVTFEFQYIITDEIPSANWLDMRVDMEQLFAYSDAVNVGANYSVRYRTVSAGGVFTDWSDPIEVDATDVPIEFDGGEL